MLKTQGLSCIGGYQSSASSFDCLFFTFDRPPRNATQYYCRNLTCEQWGTDDLQLKEIEKVVQDIHLDD